MEWKVLKTPLRLRRRLGLAPGIRVLGFFIFQAVQIVLGVFSGVLGGFLFISYTTLLGSGAPIWTGAVVSGAGGPWAEGPPIRGERPPPSTPSECRLFAAEKTPRSLG